MRKFLLVTVFVAAVAVSGCTSQPAQDQATRQPETGETSETVPSSGDAGDNRTTYRIYYTSSGFQPSDVTIQKGETVVWINNASDMWVASNEHPTHTLHDGTSTGEHCEYPRNAQRQERIGNPFDSCASVDRFSYTFEKVDEWGYHNHRFAAHGGTVTVEG